MAEIGELEAQDGIRMPWNVIPGTKEEESKCIIPVSAIYSPLKSHLSPLPYSPLRCRSCRSVLNPFSIVDFSACIWICPFCHHRNPFPPNYSSITETNLPPELFPHYTTVEYLCDSYSSPSPPVFLFVVDTCIISEELEFLKSALSQALGLLPDTSLVGLITFGSHVHVHELGFHHCPKSYVFPSHKEITKDQLLDHLNFFLKNPRPSSGVIAGARDGLSSDDISRFLLPSSDCQFTLHSVLEDLQSDPWPVAAGQRSARSTGAALSIAAGLLGLCFPGSGARIMAFIGGPSTEGPGAIVSRVLSEPIRSHKDIDKDSAPYYYKAVEFYKGLATQLAHQGHILDVFACAVDQVGLAELKVAVERTGGLVVLGESFNHSVFRDSLRRVFQTGETNLGLSSCGIFEVNCSKDLKIQGLIGPCTSLENKGSMCSDTIVGEGGTSAWKMCGLDENTSLCVVFEIAKNNTADDVDVTSPGNQFYFQFLTYYQHSNGQTRLRVTTLSRRWVAGARSIPELTSGFDQEAAAVVMARVVSFKMETRAGFDPLRWLDMALINLCSRFGDYERGRPSSFTLSPQFSNFPQLMYHLRRSPFVQIVNQSPDETAYHRILLNRENTSNSVAMIQPLLMSFSLHAGPDPALLDVVSITADKILVLDSYFTIVIFHGTTIAQWRKSGYHNQPEHQAFAHLLQAPRDCADTIINARFPAPRIVICDQYGSQARFLLARLNPSTASNNGRSPSSIGSHGDGSVVLTDDVSFEMFFDHLQRSLVLQ